MTPSDVPFVPGALKALCAMLDVDRRDFARALGLSRNTLWRIETGKAKLTEERLNAALAFLGVTREELEVAVHLTASIHHRKRSAGVEPPPPDPESRRARFAGRFAAAVRATRTLLDAKIRSVEVDEAIEEAGHLWRELAARPQSERIALIESCDEFLTPALLARLCDESVKAAARSASDAVDLADLALSVAGRAPGTEAQRAGRLGYAWAFAGNALRVGNKLHEADAAFATSRTLYPPGLAEEPEFFDPARPLDLEASLRRDQGRFGDALRLLERALRVCRLTARPRILLNLANIQEQEGEPEKALAALNEARPAIERGDGDPRLQRVLRFNVIRNLLHLDRPAEAAALLPELKALTAANDHDLDRLRLRWLDAVVRAGLGERAEALAELGAVRREFLALDLPGDAAITGLYEAEVLLREAQNAEVRALAFEMRPIFEAFGLEREALAALRLFLEAVERDAATVAMAREAARSICRLPRRA